MTRFGLLLIVLFATAGCRDDSRYVCISDGPVGDRGCFICEGEDCDAVPPPTRSVCLAETDCAVGEVCTSIGCIAQCDTEYDCPVGTTCDDRSLCLNPLEQAPNETEPVPSPAPFQCQFNFECGDGRICIDGECLHTCLDAPCPDSQQCSAGACRPCNHDDCLTNCSQDAQCAENELCSGFQCVPDTRPTQFCPENDCQQGRVCVRGQCRTPCDTDTECARIDAAIRFCVPVDDLRLCVRASEVLANCQLSIDCGLGEECVDGSCSSREL